MIYELYLNSQQEKMFDQCADAKMKADPLNYCKSSLVTVDLSLWQQSTKEAACKEAVDAYEKNCKGN